MVSCAQLQTQIEENNTNLTATLERILLEGKEGREKLGEKFDTFGERLEKIDERLDRFQQKHVDIDAEIIATNNKIGTVEKHCNDEIELLKDRIAVLEREQQQQKQTLPAEIDALKEAGEDRTNRQLRKTLIFRNVNEVGENEAYNDTKELIAKLISENCEDVTFDYAFDNIDRAHREAKRKPRHADQIPSRQGKRLIFVAFHSWDLCQTIIDDFRRRCIREANFNISADQMYGPLTSKRRQLAFAKRKELKENGVISSGFVDFPARLMVNNTGEVDTVGKKVYKLYSDFSKHKIDAK